MTFRSGSADTGKGNGPVGSDGPKRVVVTGLGPITASGIGVEELWGALQTSRSPVSRITRFDPTQFRTHIAAQVEGFDPRDHLDRTSARRLDRYGQFTLVAAKRALDDADLDPNDMDGDRVAVQMGSALGGIAHAEAQLGIFLDRGPRALDPRLALTVFTGAASCNTAIAFGFTGPNSTNGMSCASGTIAVGEAWRLIRDGQAEVALAGGVEAPLAPLSFGAFAIIRAMSTRNDDPTRACRPFDRHRDGFVMGEGACVLVLEERAHALARGARIYAEVKGYAVTNDAHHMTAPRPDGSQASRAMRQALRLGGLAPGDVEYVNAHASSTPLNDSTESLAIRSALGDHADNVPVSGTKPYYGHALGASGAIEAAITCLVVHRGWIPPTLNLDETGEGCDLQYVTDGGRAGPVGVAVTNSFGFGGINAVLAIAADAPDY